MQRHLLLLLISVLGLALPGSAQDKPNLLLIVADDMGYGDLGCYGSLQVRTPVLDALAAGGVRCTDGYVSNSVCAPSRAGLMTGRNGARFGFEHNLNTTEQVMPEYYGIPLDEPLVSQRLQDLGYRTGLVGKWHLGKSVPEHHPLERGFESFFGMLKGHHDYWPKPGKHKLFYGHEPAKEIRTPYLTDWFTDEALDFTAGEGLEEGDGRPWFLFLSYNTPHSPMQAREDDLERYAHIRDEKRRAYCAMQHRMDENIGRIVDQLRADGELENTLIVFLSDNGGSVEVSHAVNAPLRGTKGTFFEGGIRVPTIYHWPARLEPAVYTKPVSALDVAATFVAAAGGTFPEPGVRQERKGRGAKNRPIYDSVDLLPFFRGEEGGEPHPVLYWRMALRGAAMRSGNWKLVRPNSQSIQLYDLAADVGETTDLSAEHPDVLADLLLRFNRWEANLERSPLFMSDPKWLDYGRQLYGREFSRVQPAPDDATDIWSMGFEGD